MTNFQTKNIYFITGASGVGKTTLLAQLQKKYGNKPWAFLHFDSIGVPSLQEMEQEFGSATAWQKTKTIEWIDRMVREYDAAKLFLEGQADMVFIRQGFAKHNFQNYHIILVDCDEEVMRNRLLWQRAQPELFTPEMRNWRQYLRRQAKESRTPILDSSNGSPEKMVEQFENIVGL